MRLAPVVLLAVADVPAAADEPLPALLARVDAAWLERDRPGRMEEMRAALDAAERAAPGDYGHLWRRARMLWWLADDPAASTEEKSRLGKECWDAAERAVVARPDGVEGWFYASAGVGNHALGMGILTALARGMEGKYRERLARAESLAADFDRAAIPTSWGRFWYELPWPKYDARKSEAALQRALEMNPRSVRAMVYLAELYRKEGRAGDATRVLERAVAPEREGHDPPDERRYRARAVELLSARP